METLVSGLTRRNHSEKVRALLADSPVVATFGARPVGKTTRALRLIEESNGPGERFDLEDPADLAGGTPSPQKPVG